VGLCVGPGWEDGHVAVHLGAGEGELDMVAAGAAGAGIYTLTSDDSPANDLPVPPPPPPPTHVPTSAPPAAATSSAAADGPNIVVIKSPMIGTFYSRPNPKAEAYVKVGDRVDTTTVVCIIEAMKVFNEIPAETRGQIVAVLAADGEAVDFEKPLFKVNTSS